MKKQIKWSCSFISSLSSHLFLFLNFVTLLHINFTRVMVSINWFFLNYNNSIYGGFVRWQMGTKEDGSDSIAVQVADENVRLFLLSILQHFTFCSIKKYSSFPVLILIILVNLPIEKTFYTYSAYFFFI